MQFNLDANEINFIIQVLGQLPTSSGAYPLVVKIQQQVEAQQSQDEVKSEQLKQLGRKPCKNFTIGCYQGSVRCLAFYLMQYGER